MPEVDERKYTCAATHACVDSCGSPSWRLRYTECIRGCGRQHPRLRLRLSAVGRRAKGRETRQAACASLFVFARISSHWHLLLLFSPFTPDPPHFLHSARSILTAMRLLRSCRRLPWDFEQHLRCRRHAREDPPLVSACSRPPLSISRKMVLARPRCGKTLSPSCSPAP